MLPSSRDVGTLSPFPCRILMSVGGKTLNEACAEMTCIQRGQSTELSLECSVSNVVRHPKKWPDQLWDLPPVHVCRGLNMSGKVDLQSFLKLTDGSAT